MPYDGMATEPPLEGAYPAHAATNFQRVWIPARRAISSKTVDGFPCVTTASLTAVNCN